MPFWSSLARVEKIVANVEAYSGFRPRQVGLEALRESGELAG